MSLKRFLGPLLSLVLAFVSTSAFAAYALNMTPGVTPVSHAVYGLHMTILWICAAIGTVVFGVMLFVLLRHRKSLNHPAASFHENTTIEVIWTVIPFLILIFMAVPATKVLIALEDTSKSDLTIKITGHQWKWQYEYLESEITFFSNLSTPTEQINNQAPKGEHYLLEVDNHLVVPINKKIRFLLTANDVIHSWWVPALGFKKDAIPGFINESWAKIEEPGIYRGQCAELCGLNHGYMPIVIEARTQEDYDKWVEDQKQSAADALLASKTQMTFEELMKKGETVYKTVCVACHQANGQGLPPAFPALKGGKIALGPVADHIHMVLHGKTGTAMQAFGAQLHDVDLAAVITYERNAWGNNTKDIVQPADIKAAR
jgi:cytochrome c oxidase subunit 2